MEINLQTIPTIDLFDELESRGYYLEHKDYFNEKNIMMQYDIGKKKAQELAKEFEKEVKKGDFYRPTAFIRYSNKIWELHKNQFRHFLNYRNYLKDKNFRKSVPKYHPEDFL